MRNDNEKRMLKKTPETPFFTNHLVLWSVGLGALLGGDPVHDLHHGEKRLPVVLQHTPQLTSHVLLAMYKERG